MVTLIRRDVLSEMLVETEATRLLPSQPRAGWRVVASSEALRTGSRANRRTSHSSEALRFLGLGRGVVLGPRSRPCGEVGLERIGDSAEACGCYLASAFTRSKQFFRSLLRVPLLVVSDSSPRASGGVGALFLRVCRDLACSHFRRDCVLLLEVLVGAREHTRQV